MLVVRYIYTQKYDQYIIKEEGIFFEKKSHFIFVYDDNGSYFGRM